MAKKRIWREKLLDAKDLPKTVTLKPKMQKHWNGHTLAIPSPMEVNEIMASVPKGKLITTQELLRIVAKKHLADMGCPLTCGLFSWIAAYAAEEEAKEGRKRITPYWRTLKTGGELNPKFPGGLERQKGLLKSEGHQIIQKGKKAFVEDFEKKVIKG